MNRYSIVLTPDDLIDLMGVLGFAKQIANGIGTEIPERLYNQIMPLFKEAIRDDPPGVMAALDARIKVFEKMLEDQ